MKALLVSSIYPPTIGGPAPHTQQIAREWARVGHDVTVCVPAQVQPPAPETAFGLVVLPGGQGGGPGGKLRRWLGWARALHRLLRTRRPDFCVMMVFGGPLAFITGLLCRLHRVPALVKLTGEKALESAMERQLDAPAAAGEPRSAAAPAGWDWLLTRLFRAVWATTPAFVRRLQRDYQLRPERILLLPNFIDTARFKGVGQVRASAGGGPWRLLTVCRLRPWKGVETCLRAGARLGGLPWTWEFVGSGPAAYEESLRQLARDLGIESRVCFRGEVPPERIVECYRRADLLVLLSDYEPFGIVLLEAMAAGVPIVASRAGGIPFVTDQGRCARLVSAGDAEGAASAIRNLLLDPVARQNLATLGQARAGEFGIVQGCRRLAEYAGRLGPSRAAPVAATPAVPVGVGAQPAVLISHSR